MVKTLLVALSALLIVALPAVSVAQMTNAPGFSFSPAQPITSSAGYFSGCVFEPTLTVGYKRLGLNFNSPVAARQVLREIFPGFPLFQQYASLLDVYPLDIKLEKANLLMGGLGLRISNPRSGLAGFFNVFASSPRSVSLTSSTGPGIGQIPPEAVSWSGSQFQWSQYDLGGSYRLRAGLGVIGGVKFERSSVKFSEPEPAPGYTRFVSLFRRQTATFPNYGGDFQLLFTKPYVGIEVFGSYFKGSLLVGAANADLRIPLRLNHRGAYIGFTLRPFLPLGFGVRNLAEQATYSMKQPGVFVEANLESNFTVRQGLDINLWVQGAVTRVRGDGDVSLNGKTTGFFRIFRFPFRFPTSFSDGATAESTINQYDLGCGANASLRF